MFFFTVKTQTFRKYVKKKFLIFFCCMLHVINVNAFAHRGCQFITQTSKQKTKCKRQFPMYIRHAKKVGYNPLNLIVKYVQC